MKSGAVRFTRELRAEATVGAAVAPVIRPKVRIAPMQYESWVVPRKCSLSSLLWEKGFLFSCPGFFYSLNKISA